MTADREALKRKAEAAMRGPWRVVDANEGEHRPLWIVQAEHQTDDEGMALHVGYLNDAEYIAAASPDVVLSLLAELEAAEARANTYGWRLNDAVTISRRLEAERDQLKAEVERLRAALEAVAVSKFATEPHRIAREALESISPGKREAR